MFVCFLGISNIENVINLFSSFVWVCGEGGIDDDIFGNFGNIVELVGICLKRGGGG